MYTLTVRDHFMIAHSFRGEVFGPAQKLHGATYVVDLEFQRDQLDPDGLVVDIGLASQALSAVLAELNYRNLDDVPDLAGKNTTTEFLARWVFDRVAVEIDREKLGSHAKGLDALRITLKESHIAWASYQGRLDDRSRSA